MKLLYRGIPYEAPAQSAPTDHNPQNKVRLIYRGHTFERELQPSSTPESIPMDAPVVTLMYRGQTYQRRVLNDRPYQQPRAINWRWQFSSQS